MKRQSKAEEALNKQVKAIDNTIASYELAIKGMQDKIYAIQDIRKQLVSEIEFMKSARIKASESRKP
jgi:acetyl-CoA carboxylase carboxyltransferase component